MSVDIQNLISGMGGGSATTPDGLFDIKIEDISKALGTSASSGSNGGALVPESLDPTLKIMARDPDNQAPKLRRWYAYNAKSNLEQYVRVNKLGLATHASMAEGDLGPQDSPTFERVSDQIYSYGKTFSVTDRLQAAAESKFGDTKALVAMLTFKSLMNIFERYFWWGNNSRYSTQWNGLMVRRLTDSEHLKDLTANTDLGAVTGTAGSRTYYSKGGVLSIDELRSKFRTAVPYNGKITGCYLHPEDMDIITRSKDSAERIFLTEKGQSRIAPGQIVTQLGNAFSETPVDLIWDPTLYDEGVDKLTPENPAVSSNFHPDAPAAPATAPTGVAGAGEYLEPADYTYAVSFVNEVAEGPITIQSTAYTADNTNGKVTLTITHPAGIKAIRIYRSSTASATYANMRFMAEISPTSSTSTSRTYVDDGTVLPGRRNCMIMDERVTGVGYLIAPTMEDLARNSRAHQCSIAMDAALSAYDGMQREFTWIGIGGSALDPS